MRLLDGARPAFNSWNNFTFDIKESKTPRNRQSDTSFMPKKRLQLGLKENENQRTSDKDFKNTGSDHECNSNRPTPLDCTQEKGVSITDTTDEHLKAKREILSSNKTCKHYTGFSTIKRLKEVYKFLNSGENGENVIFYHNQDMKVEELGDGRGQKRALESFEAFLLTLECCRCNFSVTHLAHLFETTESTGNTTFITWI